MLHPPANDRPWPFAHVSALARSLAGSLTSQAAFLTAVTAVVLYLVLGPLVLAVFATFLPNGVLPSEARVLTFENYSQVFLDPRTWRLMVNTLIFAVGSLALGTSLAVLLSWLVERSDMPLRGLVFALVIAPLAIPGMLSAISWVFLLDPSIGLVNLMIRGALGLEGGRGPFNPYSLGGMVFVEGLRMVPTVVLMMAAAFRHMDPSLEEASRIAGKSALPTFFRITLPVIRPALLGAMLYYFIVAVEAFDVPGILGMSAGVHVFSTRIYWALHPVRGDLPNYGLASTLGLLIMMIAFGLLMLYNRLTRNARDFVTVTGKGYRPYRVRLNRWKYPTLAFCGLYSVISLVLPGFILLWSSLHAYYTPPSLAGLKSLSFKPYIELWEFGGISTVLLNTLWMALLAATAAMALSTATAWVTVRSRSRLRHVVDVLCFLPQALPSIVVAMAVMLVYLSFPNPFYGTIYIIAIALATRYLSYGTRTMKAGLLQIHPELEEASRVSGVGWWRTWLRVILPLAMPTFVNGWIWAAVLAARELSVSLVLYTPDSVMISTAVWSMWESGRQASAAALGVILICLLILLNGCARLVLDRFRYS